jgi:hypothetical protein
MLLIHLVSRLYRGVTIWGVDVHASQREKALAIGATDFFSLPASLQPGTEGVEMAIPDQANRLGDGAGSASILLSPFMIARTRPI